ncbi:MULTISPECIES: hypothetical protein [Antarcticibacterium]|uniref:hypothetical protein n=1 Tax=Antarcticibacterium TaxID=2058174 RepID=UPI00143CCB47|nr:MULTISPECIES: hypothetical protein [Antarcticibacterium]
MVCNHFRSSLRTFKLNIDKYNIREVFLYMAWGIFSNGDDSRDLGGPFHRAAWKY